MTGPSLRSSFSLCFGPFITLLPIHLGHLRFPSVDYGVRKRRKEVETNLSLK